MPKKTRKQKIRAQQKRAQERRKQGPTKPNQKTDHLELNPKHLRGQFPKTREEFEAKINEVFGFDKPFLAQEPTIYVTKKEAKRRWPDEYKRQIENSPQRPKPNVMHIPPRDESPAHKHRKRIITGKNGVLTTKFKNRVVQTLIHPPPTNLVFLHPSDIEDAQTVVEKALGKPNTPTPPSMPKHQQH